MLTCKIVTHNKNSEFKNLVSVSIPCTSGNIDVLTSHAETFFVLAKGEVILRARKSENKIDVSKGVGHIFNDEVILFL